MGFVITMEKYLKEPGVTEVKIPDYVTKIFGHAIPDGITSVVMPKGVTEIESDAFKLAKDLLSITVDPDNPVYCDIDGVLYSKDKTVLVCYPRGRQDTEFVIPDTVTEIGNRAFCECESLTSVILPKHVTTIGDTAFAGSGLTSIDFPDSLKEISRLAFAECNGLTSVVIPDGVTDVYVTAFGWCMNLKSVRIPRSMTYLDYLIFGDCSSLTSVEIPDSVTKIDDNAFRGCKRLTILTTPGSYADSYAQKNGIRVAYVPLEERRIDSDTAK